MDKKIIDMKIWRKITKRKIETVKYFYNLSKIIVCGYIGLERSQRYTKKKIAKI